MIEVHCECGKTFTVPDDYAGRVGRCAHCGRQVLIARQSASQPKQEAELTLVDEKADAMAKHQREYDALKQAIAAAPNAPDPHVLLAELCEGLGRKTEALEHYRMAFVLDSARTELLDRIEAIGGPIERAKLEEGGDEKPADDFWQRLPMAFLFPFRGTGLFILIGGAVFYSMVELMAKFAHLFGIMAGAVGGFYLAQYALDTIAHVANGRDEPPDWPMYTSLSELALGLLPLIACFTVSSAPGVAYGLAVGASGLGFYACIGFGLLYFPMSVLAVTILQTALALSPHVILPAILRTHVRYFATVLVVFITYGVEELSRRILHIPFVTQFLMIYFLLVETSALGMFYHANAERLGWFEPRVMRDA